MGRRACTPDEVSDLVSENRPEGAYGYFLIFKNQTGRMERQPPSDFWGLMPADIPVGIPEGLLHVHYVDDHGGLLKPASARERLVLEYLYDPFGDGAAQGSAGQQFSALVDKLGSSCVGTRSDPDEDREADPDELAALQGAQQRQLHLLTMDSLQNFLRDTLSHFVRLQEAATKGSQAQIEASIANMKLLTQQSTKLLETQLAAAQITKERVEELQAAPSSSSFDLPGVLSSVLPFLQTLWQGGPARPGLPGSGATPRLGVASSSPDRDVLDVESFPGGTPPAAPPGSSQGHRTQAAVGVIREVLDPSRLDRLVTEPAALEQFLQRMRKAATAPASPSSAASGSGVMQPAAGPMVPWAEVPVHPGTPILSAPSDPPEEEGTSLAELIAQITGASRT